jgi:hypothetical protein
LAQPLSSALSARLGSVGGAGVTGDTGGMAGTTSDKDLGVDGGCNVGGAKADGDDVG